VAFHAFPLGSSETGGNLHERGIDLGCRDHTILDLLLNSLGLRGLRLDLVRLSARRVGLPYLVANSPAVGWVGMKP
jgi:hypothetical protein